jgi:hypothetical protein
VVARPFGERRLADCVPKPSVDRRQRNSGRRTYRVESTRRGAHDRFALEADADIVDLTGTDAIVVEVAGRVSITWTLTDDTSVTFGLIGDRANAVAIVRSIETVDATTWRDASQPSDPPSDGCQSLFC